jgi:predicted GNAT superfamily acetyltransferase
MIEVREVLEHAELAEAVRLQNVIWGFTEVDMLPHRLFVVATKVGGHVGGAFDGKRMIGFSIAIPGVKTDGTSYWHSNMMGVLAEYRDQGVGRRLKLLQRSDALSRGINLVEWTFDPLEIKNAFFNIVRLGAVIRRYVLNQYGTTTSPLHGGLPTDRCVAEWHIASPRVALALDSRVGVPVPDIRARIAVPEDIGALRTSDPHRVREIQSRVSEQFLSCLDQGLTVIGFERTKEAGIYLLGPWQSE